MKRIVKTIIEHFWQTHISDQPVPTLSFEIERVGPRISVSCDNQTTEGTLSAWRLFGGEFWARFQKRYAYGVPCLQIPNESFVHGLSARATDQIAPALFDAASILIGEGHKEEAALCIEQLHLRFNKDRFASRLAKFPETFRNQLNEPTKVELALCEINRATPNAALKRIIPFASDNSPRERVGCARQIRSILEHLSYSDILLIDKTIGKILDTLCLDPVSLVRQEALWALDLLTLKEHERHAYAEYLPHVEVLLSAGWNADDQLARRYEYRMSQMMVHEAQNDWKELINTTPTSTGIQLQRNIFDVGNWEEWRACALSRISLGQLAWVRGKDPCEYRLTKRWKPISLSEHERTKRINFALKQCHEAVLADFPTLEKDLASFSDQPNPTDSGSLKNEDLQRKEIEMVQRGFHVGIWGAMGELLEATDERKSALAFFSVAQQLEERFRFPFQRGKYRAKVESLQMSLGKEPEYWLGVSIGETLKSIE